MSVPVTFFRNVIRIKTYSDNCQVIVKEFCEVRAADHFKGTVFGFYIYCQILKLFYHIKKAGRALESLFAKYD